MNRHGLWTFTVIWGWECRGLTVVWWLWSDMEWVFLLLCYNVSVEGWLCVMDMNRHGRSIFNVIWGCGCRGLSVVRLIWTDMDWNYLLLYNDVGLEGWLCVMDMNRHGLIMFTVMWGCECRVLTVAWWICTDMDWVCLLLREDVSVVGWLCVMDMNRHGLSTFTVMWGWECRVLAVVWWIWTNMDWVHLLLCEGVSVEGWLWCDIYEQTWTDYLYCYVTIW